MEKDTHTATVKYYPETNSALVPEIPELTEQHEIWDRSELRELAENLKLPAAASYASIFLDDEEVASVSINKSGDIYYEDEYVEAPLPELTPEEVLHAMEQGVVRLSDETRDDVDGLHCEIGGYNFYFTSKHADDTLAEFESAVPDPLDRAREVLHGLESLRDEVNPDEYEYYAECILDCQPPEHSAGHSDDILSHPFADLTVRYGGSAADIRRPDGTPYPNHLYDPEDNVITLRGADAYEFLACLNREDKRLATLSQESGGLYKKTWVGFSYGDCHTEDKCISLGELELGNSTSVADALNVWLCRPLQYVLDDPSILKEALASDKSLGIIPHDTKLGEYDKLLQMRIEEIYYMAERFREEENLYLKNHPELRAINEEKARPFYYVCKESDFNTNWRRMDVLDAHPADAFRNCLLVRPGLCCNRLLTDYLDDPKQAEEKHPDALRFAKDLDESLIVFSSLSRPDRSIYQQESDVPPCMLLVPEEELMDMLPLRQLECQREDGATPAHGLHALDRFAGSVQRDYWEASAAVRNQCYIPHDESSAVKLLFNGKPVFEKEYFCGSGELLRTVPQYLPEIKDKRLNEILSKAYDTLCRYQKNLPSRHEPMVFEGGKVNPYWKLPDRETSVRNLPELCHKPDKTVYGVDAKSPWMEQAAAYYVNLGRILAEEHGTIPAREAATKALIEDGYNEKQIKKIVGQSGDAAWNEAAKDVLSRSESRKRIRALNKDTGR